METGKTALLTLHKCARCGHNWESRGDGKPRRCAKCKAHYWDRPARVAKRYLPPNPVGRPRKYPQLETLGIGETCLLPWESLLNGDPDHATNELIPQCVYRFALATSRKFATCPESGGLRVIRSA